MHDSSALDGWRQPGSILLALVLGAAGAVVLIGSSSLAALRRDGPPARAPIVAAAPADAAQAAADLRRFAVNLLLLPLLDDDVPPRWTLAGLHQECSDGPAVSIDGRPVVWGHRVPPGSYVVRRELTPCQVFGDDRLGIAGSVTMTVFPDDSHGLTAIVQPHGVRITSDSGAVVALDHAFVAREKQIVEPDGGSHWPP